MNEENTGHGRPLTRSVKIAMLNALERDSFTQEESTVLLSFLQENKTGIAVEIIDHRLFICSDKQSGEPITEEQFEERLEDARERYQSEKERYQKGYQ